MVFYLEKRDSFSLSPSLSTSFASSPTHSRQIFFSFWVTSVQYNPSSSAKDGHFPPRWIFFKTKYKKLIVHPSQTIPPSSLSLSLFLKIVTKYLEKQKQEKLICVCVLCCVRCGRSETFFCVEWDKNRFDNNNKKTFRYLPFLVLCFRYFFFFFLISRLWRSKNFPIRVFIHPQSPMLCVCVSGIENMEPTDWVLHLIPYIFLKQYLRLATTTIPPFVYI